MGLDTKFRNYQEELQTSGAVAVIFNFFQGRSTAFALIFTVCGIILTFQGKLTANYALFVTAIQGLVFAHSCKEDWQQQKMSEIQNTTNVTVTDTKATSSTAVQTPAPLEGK
jgi:hypothetical protein